MRSYAEFVKKHSTSDDCGPSNDGLEDWLPGVENNDAAGGGGVENQSFCRQCLLHSALELKLQNGGELESDDLVEQVLGWVYWDVGPRE